MKAGDIVRLKSGSNPMTVETVGADSNGVAWADCVWFSWDGPNWSGPHGKRFLVSSLKAEDAR